MTVKISVATTAALWMAAGAVACANNPGASDHELRHKQLLSATQEAQELWVTRRKKAWREAEAQAEVIGEARSSLRGQKITMQRDAAICLEARRMMDDNLRKAMQSKCGFATELEQWHAQEHGVRMFCAYALAVGMPD